MDSLFEFLSFTIIEVIKWLAIIFQKIMNLGVAEKLLLDYRSREDNSTPMYVWFASHLSCYEQLAQCTVEDRCSSPRLSIFLSLGLDCIFCTKE